MHGVSYWGSVFGLPQFDFFILCKEEKALHSRLSHASKLVILGNPSHPFSFPQDEWASCSGRTCLRGGGQPLHQQQRGADDQPAPRPRGHGSRLLARQQLLHRQQPHGSGEAQPVGPGRLAEPKATRRESEEPAGSVWTHLSDCGDG